ncbi:MAG TPA: HhH-GPD-type base excision DNA repair protein [Gaiellales bacterium]|nr:HhH-GPD-type base excision DNA repair protein [Gaiellales bacterium]
MPSATAPATLPWTEDDEANRLLASDPNALLIGFALDQQVTVQKAFAGPLVLKQRLGHLDPGRIAAMPPDELEAAFREKPAIHRFPGAMAGRVQTLCGVIADRYGGDGSRVWTEAASARDLVDRLGQLPGIGDMKVRSLVATLVKQFGVRPEGWEEVLPSHPTLGDVNSAEALAEYQAAKRAHKAKVRAEQSRTG